MPILEVEGGALESLWLNDEWVRTECGVAEGSLAVNRD